MLGNLIPQLTPEVEVVIRDDSSNSITQEIVKRKLESCGVTLQYFKGEKIGLDLANLFLLEKARGKYIWWFSDDDELASGAIAHVLELVKKHPEIDFMWANFAYGEDRKLAVSFPEERFFRDRNEIFELVGHKIGLLSTLILKREKGLPFLELGRKQSTGFGFAALVPVFGVLANSEKSFFLRGPYVFNHPTTIEEIKEIATRTGEIKNDAFDVYGVNFYQIVMLFRNKFKRRSVRKLLGSNFGCVWRGMLVGWVGGWDTPKGKRWRMFKLYWSYPEFWLAIVLLLLPLPINKFLYKIYKLFFEQRKFRFGKNFELNYEFKNNVFRRQ